MSLKIVDYNSIGQSSFSVNFMFSVPLSFQHYGQRLSFRCLTFSAHFKEKFCLRSGIDLRIQPLSGIIITSLQQLGEEGWRFFFFRVEMACGCFGSYAATHQLFPQSCQKGEQLPMPLHVLCAWLHWWPQQFLDETDPFQFNFRPGSGVRKPLARKPLSTHWWTIWAGI